MALLKKIENTAITLPLDTVLEVLRGLQGKPVSPDTMALLKVEVGYSVSCLPVEPEVAMGILRETFGE